MAQLLNFTLKQLTQKIRYTVDGSEPNENSLLYTSPIMILNDFTLKAKGFKPNYAQAQPQLMFTHQVCPKQSYSFFWFSRVDSQVEIDNDQNTITAYVPAGTYIYGLIPIIQLEAGCTVSPDNGIPQNFIEPVIYTVSSLSGQRVYTVNVIKSICVCTNS